MWPLDLIKRTLQYRAGGITNSGQLFDTILDIWQNFTVEYVQNLYQSISRRVLACIRSKGHIAKY
jgi:hypothetical protein